MTLFEQAAILCSKSDTISGDNNGPGRIRNTRLGELLFIFRAVLWIIDYHGQVRSRRKDKKYIIVHITIYQILIYQIVLWECNTFYNLGTYKPMDNNNTLLLFGCFISHEESCWSEVEQNSKSIVVISWDFHNHHCRILVTITV